MGQFIYVRPYERIWPGKPYKVRDDHEVADVETGIHAACCIVTIKPLAAQKTGHAYRIGRLCGGVSLIDVQPALHHEYTASGQRSGDKAACVSRGG